MRHPACGGTCACRLAPSSSRITGLVAHAGMTKHHLHRSVLGCVTRPGSRASWLERRQTKVNEARMEGLPGAARTTAAGPGAYYETEGINKRSRCYRGQAARRRYRCDRCRGIRQRKGWRWTKARHWGAAGGRGAGHGHAPAPRLSWADAAKSGAGWPAAGQTMRIMDERKEGRGGQPLSVGRSCVSLALHAFIKKREECKEAAW